MHYLVDAYNLLFRILKKSQPLEKARQEIIEAFNAIAAEAHLQITLVFDGADEHLPYSSRRHLDAVEFVYTPKNKTADDYILEEVMSAPHPAQITVVTNDRELSQRCNYYRANILTIDAFITLVSKKKKSPHHKNVSIKSREFRESSREFVRLLAIFERKLSNDE